MPDSGAAATAFSPLPILDCIERYRGTITEIESGAVWSADAFARAREAFTARLASCGVAPGDRVALAVSNGPHFIAAFAGILACGASPLFLHAKTPAAELQRYAKKFGLQFLVREPEADDEADAFGRILETFEFAPQTSLRIRRFNFDNLVQARANFHAVPLHPSSGSTGAPKIAMRPGPVAIEDGRYTAEALGAGPGDRILAVAPMNHIYGFGMTVMAPMLTGADIITLRAFSVDTCTRAITECTPTVLPLTPSMLGALALGRVGSLASARWVFCAGAALTRKTLEHFRQHTGAMVSPGYGSTETGAISIARDQDGTYVDGRVGTAIKGVEVETRVSPTGGDQGAHTLFVKTKGMMTGYLDDQDQIITPQAQGWISTGDLAVVAPNGDITLRGRNSDMINLSGLKVMPVEVEEVIAAFAGVVEVKVYKGEHAFGQTIVKALVAVRKGVTEADIREHCKQHLVYYKRPHVVTLVDRLPRNWMGKIDLQRLP